MMSEPEDSRPFVVLKQQVSDFMSGFDEDIKSCLDHLDSKLSTLILDPGMTKTPSKDGSRLSVDIQFTRAKYDIYMNMKSLFEELESTWKEQLGEMKNSFLENVEILLAKTKLDEKSAKNDATKKSLKNNYKDRIESSINSSTSSPYSLLVKATRLPGSVLSSFLPQANETENDENGYSVSFKSADPGQIKNSPSPKKTLLQNIEETRIDEEMDEEEEIQNVVSARSKRNRAKISVAPKSAPTKQLEVVVTPLRKKATRGRKSILKPDSIIESELHTTPSRSTRKKTAGKDTNLCADDVMECEADDLEALAAPKTPKNVHFSVGLNVHEDLEIYSPEVNLTRSAPRRKTVITELVDNITDISLTPDVVRTKSKRKTFGGSALENSLVAPSPKRFKSSRKSIATVIETKDADLSRSESSSAGQYTPWLLLDELDGKVPSQAGVYELKVYKAKKSAYIGSCDNLRHKLTLHKLCENSGHKHLDKFLERNKREVQVRYEIMTSATQAKNEEMKRIKSFVEQYRTTPCYN